MPALIVFIAFFILALICGALLAFPMHILLTNWFELDFERISSRCVLVVTIVLFIALFRKFGFRSWKEIGFNNNRKNFLNDISKGFSVGIVIMSPVVIGLLISNNRIIDLNWGWTFSNISLLLVTALAAGLIGALIEETLFRGAMLTAIQQRGSTLLAVISTSFIYALVHFLQPGTYLEPNTLSWLSGFSVLKDAFSSLLQPAQIVDSFIALFLAGTLLAIIKIRAGSLAMCIGVHAGWVFTIKIFRRVTNSNENSDYAFLTGSYDQVIGYLAAVCVTLAIIIYISMKNRSQMN